MERCRMLPERKWYLESHTTFNHITDWWLKHSHSCPSLGSIDICCRMGLRLQPAKCSQG